VGHGALGITQLCHGPFSEWTLTSDGCDLSTLTDMGKAMFAFNAIFIITGLLFLLRTFV
jgi:hypothetical protein